MFFKNSPEISLCTVYNHFPRTVVYASGKRAVNAAEIYDQLSVYKKPEIIVSRKAVYYIMPPGIEPVRGLYKACRYLHPEVIIRVFYEMEFFVLSGIRIVKRLHHRVIKIFRVF